MSQEPSSLDSTMLRGGNRTKEAISAFWMRVGLRAMEAKNSSNSHDNVQHSKYSGMGWYGALGWTCVPYIRWTVSLLPHGDKIKIEPNKGRVALVVLCL